MSVYSRSVNIISWFQKREWAFILIRHYELLELYLCVQSLSTRVHPQLHNQRGQTERHTSVWRTTLGKFTCWRTRFCCWGEQLLLSARHIMICELQFACGCSKGLESLPLSEETAQFDVLPVNSSYVLDALQESFFNRICRKLLMNIYVYIVIHCTVYGKCRAPANRTVTWRLAGFTSLLTDMTHQHHV